MNTLEQWADLINIVKYNREYKHGVQCEKDSHFPPNVYCYLESANRLLNQGSLYGACYFYGRHIMQQRLIKQ